MIIVNDDNFEKEVLKSEKPVLVYVRADWCVSCKKQISIIQKFDEEKQNIKVVKIDADDSPNVCSQLKIKGLPSLFVFNNGIQTNFKSGLLSYSDLENLIK